MTQQHMPPPPYLQELDPEARASRAKPRWYRRTWVLVIVSGLVGIGVGAASSTTDVTTSPEYKVVANERSEVQDALAASDAAVDELNGEVSDLEGQLVEVQGKIPAREAAVKKAEAAVKKRENTVDAQEKSVLKRERAVGLVEREIEANTVAGNGIYEVGRDMKPGTYRSADNSGCYYAILGSPNTSDILDNNNVDGPAIVSVSAGQYLELSGCSQWVLQR